MLSRILLAAATVGLIGSPAETLHYKIVVKSGQAMDMSALGQGMMNININATTWVAITTKDSSGVQLLHVVVDSESVDAGDLPFGASADMMKVASGTSIDLTVVDGKIQPLGPEAMADAPGLGLVISGVYLLYPSGMRTNARVGESWVDTVTTDTTTQLGKGTSTQIRKWKATSRSGDALVLDNEFTGTMTIGGGMADMNGTSTGTTHLVIGPKGPAREASTDGKTSMTMAIPGAPSPIQMNATSAVSITPIK